MRVLKVIALGIVGFFVGFGLWKLSDVGAGESWTPLPAPPQPVSELIPFRDPPLYIKTGDGKTYYYSDFHNQGWLEQPVPAEMIGPLDVTRPCNRSSAPFSFSPNAPRDIVDCLQTRVPYADGAITYAFVRDSQGLIWQWRHTVSPQDLPAMLCLPPCGLLFAGWLAYVLTEPRPRPQQPPPDSP